MIFKFLYSIIRLSGMQGGSCAVRHPSKKAQLNAQIGRTLFRQLILQAQLCCCLSQRHMARGKEEGAVIIAPFPHFYLCSESKRDLQRLVKPAHGACNSH